jgi:drug/metabolite transporter (DMT)-like permease
VIGEKFLILHSNKINRLNMSHKSKGLFFGVLAAATYGMNPLFALPLYSDGMSVESVLAMRYTFAALTLGLMMVYRKVSFDLTRKQLVAVASLGITMALSSLTLFYSYNYMEAGIASTMLFLYPLLVALLMGVIYREHISKVTGLSLLMATLGIVMLMFGKPGVVLSGVGVILVMISALTYAIYIIGVNKSAASQLSTLKLTFYVITFGALLYDVIVAVHGPLILPHNPWRWVNVFALALLPTVVSLVSTTIAIQNVGSTITAILGVFEPVTAVFFGILVFDERLTGREVVGIVMIMLAVCTVIAAGNRKQTAKDAK